MLTEIEKTYTIGIHLEINMTEQIKSFLANLVLNTELSIDEIEQVYCTEFVNEDADLLGQIWVEVMETLPELN